MSCEFVGCADEVRIDLVAQWPKRQRMHFYFCQPHAREWRQKLMMACMGGFPAVHVRMVLVEGYLDEPV